MARIRSIHPDALKSQKLAAASAEAERLYWRLQTNCDDDGRAEDEPRLLAAYLFPMSEDITGATVDGWLKELDALGLLSRYEVADKPYLQIERWADYQKPQKRTESKLPPLPDDYERPTTPLREDYANGHVEDWQGEGVGGGEGGGEGISTPLSSSTPEPGTELELVTSSPTATGPVETVFAAWRESTAKTRAHLSPERRKVITKALKTYPVDELVDAVCGWRLDPHCRGENDRHTVYNDLELLLRDAKHIEKFRDLARGSPSERAAFAEPRSWQATRVLEGLS